MVALGKGASAEMVQLLIDFGASTSTSQGQGLADWVTGSGVSVSDEVKALLEGQIFYRTRITFELFHNNTLFSAYDHRHIYLSFIQHIIHDE